MTPFRLSWASVKCGWTICESIACVLKGTDGLSGIRCLKLKVYGMLKHFSDYDGGDFAMSISGNMVMGFNEKLMMRIG